jgi:hypothetical protein
VSAESASVLSVSARRPSVWAPRRPLDLSKSAKIKSSASPRLFSLWADRVVEK